MGWLRRFKGLFGQDRLDRELELELRAHVDMRAEDNRKAGMTSAQAERDARMRFGSVTLAKEDARRMDTLGWLEIFGQNLRYGWRMLMRSPGFTAVAVATLALGIGANVATFSVVHAVLLRPLPFHDPGQLVRVYDDLEGSHSQNVGMAPPELWDLRDRSGIFTDLSALWPVDANLTGGEHPDRIELMGTSATFFTMLGARPQLGRVYTREDGRPGFTEGVVISNGFWKRMFGGREDVLGKKIRLDGDLYTIWGVMPADFHHPGRTRETEVDVWAAAEFNAPPFLVPPQRSIRYLPGAMGRLQPGLTLAEAQARINAYTAALGREYPADYPKSAGWTARLVPVEEDLVGHVRTELLVLLGAVGCVLLITCVNLANLLLARSAGRQREIAVRQALGASRGRLFGQLLTESMLLAAISGVLAVGTVVWLKAWLLSLAPASLPRVGEVNLSAAVLLFALVLTLLTGAVFGMAPALQYSRLNPSADLREGGRGPGFSRKQMKMSRVLVASEIALSLVLLIGAGLLLKSFWHLLEVRPGFEPRHLVTAKIWLPVPNDPAQNVYATVDKRAAFLRECLRRAKGLAGVEEAALGDISSLPVSGFRTQAAFTVEKRAEDLREAPVALLSTVTPEYFEVLRTPVVAGRAFTEADNDKGQRVALVNQTLAGEYWPDGGAVGSRIAFTGPGGRIVWNEIVGVVGDIRSDGFEKKSAPHIYLPSYQAPSFGTAIFLRTASAPNTLAVALRREVQAVDPGIPVFNESTMEEVVDRYLAERRFALELLGIFAVMALVLAAIGIYGVMAYTFSQRTNEIGIRMAMGAGRGDILRMVAREGMALVAAGLLAGLAGALGVTRFLRTMLFEVTPFDPLTFVVIAALLTLVALLAAIIPAGRASRIEPLEALRHE